MNRYAAHWHAFACAALLSFQIGVVSADDAPTATWKGTWGASPHALLQFGNLPVPPPLKDVTIRQIVRISAGGSQVRVRLSNEFGSAPLIVGTASIGSGKSLLPLTFSDMATIAIPPGAPALSDPVDLEVKPGQDLSISLYLPSETSLSTLHATGLQKTELSQPGDFTKTAHMPVASSNEMRLFITGVDVLNPRAGVVVALGDSITDGMGSTVNGNQRWPDLLAERLRARKGKRTELAVVNQGIGGNQMLRDGAGVNALARFDRDVLAVPGVTHVIVLLGINDIGTPGARFGGRALNEGATVPTEGDLVAGYKQMIARAHNHGLKIIGGTLLPFAGTGSGYYTPEKDKIRQAVNRWIRNSGEFDGVIDFDAATRDPDQSDRIRSAYDSGDHLHPSSAGYKAMAEAIDLSLFD